MQGLLINYFATGEHYRPQFIGYKSLNYESKVHNYEEVYDIKIGDKIKFLDNPILKDIELPVDERVYEFLNYLTALAKNDSLIVEFSPSEGNKSWKEIQG